MTAGSRPVQTPNDFAGFPMVLGVAGATSGHENSLDVAAAADGLRQRRGRADQIRLASSLEDRNIGQAVSDVVELRVPEDPTNRFDLAVALGVVPAVARDHTVEQPEMRGDRVGDPTGRGGGKKDSSTRCAFPRYEFDHVTPIR